MGEIISPERQDSCKDLDEFGQLLRSSVYDMPLPETFVRRSELTF